MDFQINRFFNNFYRLFKIYLFFLVIFTLFRFWFFVRLGDFSEFLKAPQDILIAFIRGLQYDTLVISYILLLPFFLYIIGLFSGEKYRKKIDAFVPWYSGVTVALASVVLFVDQYYYNYFQTHISVIIFGLADDDSQTVMSSVWTDYPIIRISLAWIAIIMAFKWYYFKKANTANLNFNFSKRLKIAGVFIVCAMYSLGFIEPLGEAEEHEAHASEISDNKFANFLSVNGIYALKTSYIERKKSENIIENQLSNLKQLGYQNPAKAAADYFVADSTSRFSDSEAFAKLFEQTPENTYLEKNPPNVVFVFMESMSNYNMNFDSKQMNLLGSLRKHLSSDILFRNFVSSGNITIQSLEYLMVNSPVGLSQTKYRGTQLQSSVAIPFKRSGYQTNFITGGKVNWRSMDDFASTQRFDEVKGMSHIQAEIKNCKSNKWGVYDEFLFDYVFDKLSDREDKKPKFFFIQTTTNHTPFELPLSYKPSKIALPESLKERLLVTEELAVKNLNAYQYANNSLGDFLDKIKNSPLGENTIVVMTGDHNNLMLFDFDEAHQLQQRGVPLYMYVPENYKPATPVNTSLFASHKDIFPTIFNLSLSKTKYFSIGNNLLEANKTSQDDFFGMNIGSSTSFSNNAAVNYSPAEALYTWKNPHNKELGKVEKSREAEKLLKRSRANYALSMFYILNQISKKEKTAQL